MASSDPASLFRALPIDGPVVVFDLEWTAWEGSRERGWSGPSEEREIVEIGAVKLDGTKGLAEIISFDVFVRPTINPILSAYFTRLTNIHQTLVDNDGLSFGEALTLFEAFVGGRDVPMLSFSQDPAVLRRNCDLNRLPCPFDESRFHNVVPAIAAAAHRRPGTFSTSDLPEIFGFPPTDVAHSAVGDARCIAAALRHVIAAGSPGK
jgi:inhibitor of KinA sporulation pathway (predicted exonuclease)